MKNAMRMMAITALGLAVVTAPAVSQTKPATGFDRLKTLVGEWTGTSTDGKTFTSSIRAVSNGTAVEETFQTDTDNQMVTLYTPDGNRLAMTHYCSMGNQPHMETPAITGEASEFAFAFTSATNLASIEDMHMQQMTLKIDDSDHFTETWTLHANGKDQTKAFHLTRKK